MGECSRQKNTPSVVKSPNEAAIGVATLSGLMFKCLLAKTTAHINNERIREAEHAVASDDAHRSAAWDQST